MNDDIRIPDRFESLQNQFSEVRQLITPVDNDVRAFIRFRERAFGKNGGLLCFLLGRSGVGKTTSIHSVSINQPDLFGQVCSIPSDTEMRNVFRWIDLNAPAKDAEKATILLFDGREVSDDEVGIRQFISYLNQFLRKRPDILFCWPLTDSEWHSKLRAIAENVGGANLCPKECDYKVLGPDRSQWPSALEHLLLQFGKTFEDVGFANDLVLEIASRQETIGDFLGEMNFIISERVSRTREIKRLPNLLFVVTSSGDVTGESNRIRRAGKQILAAEPLLGHSPRSEAGKWWTERNKTPDHHLGYIISLFNASLVTCSASAVVYSCVHSDEEQLNSAAKQAGLQPNPGNANRTIQASEFFKFLSGSEVLEFTTGRRGTMSEGTIQSYGKIQELSAKKHKLINQAICSLPRVI
ncbi:hypothetical protein JDN41_13945 [Rhodomicrobium udaipurense]|uniref:Uncharacterized protein n=1 Tax=Rhodomicrobium udaipurense TaxID=1202716 RepID=A0A8I1GI52_9HYPH|nr:hypothetical protein [Rhodomicrobium udaipurense]MBJ7544651.1 hypothetical protein [Rhodomicrobium udaipurense]